MSLDCQRKHLTYQPTAADMALAAGPAAAPAEAPGGTQALSITSRASGPEPALLPGTFRGCPEICSREWLPSFKTERECRDFQQAHGPSCKVHRVWRCEPCGGWHMSTDAPSPAGASSGTTRELTRLPAKPFRRKLRESAFAGQAELPRREVVAPEPKKIEPKPKKEFNKKSERGELKLF